MNEVIITNTRLPAPGSCGLLAAAEPFFHADRIADFNVLIYVVDGVIYVTEENTDHAVRKGEMLFLKSGVHHYGKTEIQRGTRWYYIHFYLGEPPECREYSRNEADILPTEEYRLTLPKYSKVAPGSSIEQKIAQYVEYYSGNHADKKWYAGLRLWELLSSIALYSEPEAPVSLSDNIAQYLQAHCTEPFSSAAVEREFFLSYKHMAAIFKRDKGVTMQQYHDRLRMGEAGRLLTSTLMSVGDIAAAAGYQDMLYFSRRFHAFFGMSPTEYRRNAARFS